MNAIIQKREWDEFMLADVARGLDKDEESLMLEDGNTKDFQRFKKQESVNYDDTGYFSIQVVVRALEINGIKLSHFQKEENEKARKNPEREKAFLCNLKKHWFTIRRFGGVDGHWFNCNSTQKRPEYLSSTYMSLFIQQLLHEGYAVFVCRGRIPECGADRLTYMFDPVKYVPPRDKFVKQKINYAGMDKQEADQLRRALELSKKDVENEPRSSKETDFEKAIRLSRMDGGGSGQIGGGQDTPTFDREMRMAMEMSMKDAMARSEQDEEKRKEKEAKRKEEEAKRKEELEEKRKEMLQNEPEDGAEGLVILRMRLGFREGKVVQRKFLETQKIEDVFSVLEVMEATEEGEIQKMVLRMNFPKKILKYDEVKEKTLKECEIVGKVQLIVEKEE